MFRVDAALQTFGICPARRATPYRGIVIGADETTGLPAVGKRKACVSRSEQGAPLINTNGHQPPPFPQGAIIATLGRSTSRETRQGNPNLTRGSFQGSAGQFVIVHLARKTVG